MRKTLIYGYGNPGRQDDGLGVAFVKQFEKTAHEAGLDCEIDFDCNYQLNIEDALTISNYQRIIFADASTESIVCFALSKVSPATKVNFTMHAVSPEYVLHLCQTLYDKHPEVYLLHIKGYEWGMREELTQKAQSNLSKAVLYMEKKICSEGIIM